MNGTHKSLPSGIYAPTVLFFEDTKQQDIDYPVLTRHLEFLARSGIHGVVVQGSTGEAVTLTREERIKVIRTAKETFSKAGSSGAIIAGTVGAQCTREAINMCKDAAEAGADFALSLPPSYWPQWMTPDAIISFYTELADASPIPIIIYAYPGVSSGINLDTDLISTLAKHPNIAGVKHTDHDVGKIAREAAVGFGKEFTILGGATDYLLGAIAQGGQGAITGMANLAPRACLKVLELGQAGQFGEALAIQAAISQAEWGISKGGLLANKYSVAHVNGYPAHAALARRPLPVCPQGIKDHVESSVPGVVDIERKLEKAGYTGPAYKA